MKRRLLALACSLPLLPGCLYANFKAPFDTDLDRTQLGSKVGESKMQSVFWLVAWGDAGTQAAARNGGIKTITHADREVFSLLGGLYAEHTTIVYGD